MNQPNENPVSTGRPAPQGLVSILRATGPGMVVAGSVIGSGELINTPIQAATFGFILFWAIILSCVIKYFLQVELGRHCLVHQRTTVEALNLCPGPRFRSTSWVGLVYMIGYTVSLAVLVGILGATAGLMHAVLPLSSDLTFSSKLWAVILIVLTQLLLWRGMYASLEKLVTFLVAAFSVSVLAAVLLIQGTPYHVHWHQLASGLTFSLGDNPRLAAFAVISLIGALGTTANELFMYPYWVLEKGYGAYVGRAESPGWLQRARGWIRVLYVDTGLATLLATGVTAGYFLLGAAVLYQRGAAPQGLDLVDYMSRIYTESYGAWSRGLFLFGAFCTLYSTLVVLVAATGRMWADILASTQVIDRGNQTSVHRCHQVFQTIHLAATLIVFLTLNETPARLIIFGQYCNGLINTPLLILAICWLAFRTDRRLRMSPLSATLLLGSVVVILLALGLGFAFEKGWLQ